MSASGKGGRKHVAHKPKKGPDASSLEAEKEISKPDAQRASKGGFKQPTTAVGSAGEKRSLGREEEQKDDGKIHSPLLFFHLYVLELFSLTFSPSQFLCRGRL